MMLGPDLDVRLRELVRAAAEGPGSLERGVRRRAAQGEALPGPLGGFAAKLVAGSVRPQDVEALRRAGYSEDEVFELTVTAVLGWAKARLDAGLRALQESEAASPRNDRRETMTDKNVETVRAFLDAFQQGDVKNSLATLTDDVTFVAAGQPGAIPWAGRHRGIAAAERAWGIIEQNAAYESFEVLDLVAAGDKVVALLKERWRAKPTGRTCEQEYAMAFTLRGGKIAAFRSYEDTAAEAAAFQK